MASKKYLTMQEIADMLGIEYSTVSSYRSRNQMPDPDETYGKTPLWKHSTIKKWLSGRRVSA